MEVWVLVFWSATIGIVEGGQYQTERRCKERAVAQIEFLRGEAGKDLQWRCDLKRLGQF